MAETYRYGLLKPMRVADAEHVNAPLLGPQTLGIEVTEPPLAARCGLGNIDPQHSGAARADLAAIEVCLTVPLPPPGSILVTLRPDLDALGSMALLTLRAQGVEPTEQVRARVREAAEMDRFAHGPWPGQRPLPSNNATGGRTGSHPTACQLAAVVAQDERKPIEQRVAALSRFLTSDDQSPALRDDLAAYVQQIANAQAEVAAAVAEGRLMIEGVLGNRVARVESHGVPRAVQLGYCVAPVVVACDHAFRFRDGRPHRKFTVCQFTEGHVDLRGVKADLDAIERGWGGSPTIIGSPQGVGSHLSMELVLAVVERHLLRSDACVQP